MDGHRSCPGGESVGSTQAPPPLPAILTCGGIEGLESIARLEVELVIWSRTLPAALQAWIEALPAALLPDLRVLVRPEDLRSALVPLLDRGGTPSGPERELLLDDVAALVGTFARVCRSEAVDVRLERVDHDACWKFHRDSVAARLLTTYRGPATEWIRPDWAEQAVQAQRAYAGPVERLAAHDVAFFKGSCAGNGSGIVHRSPPIAGSGLTRLLLCLNQPNGASPDLWS